MKTLAQKRAMKRAKRKLVIAANGNTCWRQRDMQKHFRLDRKRYRQ